MLSAVAATAYVSAVAAHVEPHTSAREDCRHEETREDWSRLGYMATGSENVSSTITADVVCIRCGSRVGSTSRELGDIPRGDFSEDETSSIDSSGSDIYDSEGRPRVLKVSSENPLLPESP